MNDDAIGRAGELLARAKRTRGFMPEDEGEALTRLASQASKEAGRGTIPATFVEVGAYCGRSALFLAAGMVAPRPEGAPAPLLFSIDHHHGSEENQRGWPHHDADLVDPRSGRLETLPHFRAAIEDAGAGDLVVAVVGDSPSVARHWASPLGLLFIDGGHGEDPAWADYHGWAPFVAERGFLALHDVFPDPADGGRPPYELFCRAVASGAFVEVGELSRGSLRVLRRTGPGT